MWLKETTYYKNNEQTKNKQDETLKKLTFVEILFEDIKKEIENKSHTMRVNGFNISLVNRNRILINEKLKEIETDLNH